MLLSTKYNSCALQSHHWELGEECRWKFTRGISSSREVITHKTLDTLGTLFIEGNVVNLSYKELESIEGIEKLTFVNIQTGTPILLKDVGDLVLILKGNELISLPEGLFTLTNLTVLNVHGNHIDQLPDSLGNLINLRELYLGFNDLAELPSTLGLLENLKILNVEHNTLRALPASFGQLRALEELHIIYNDGLFASSLNILQLKQYFGELLPLESDINTITRSRELSLSTSVSSSRTIKDIPLERCSISSFMVKTCISRMRKCHINLSDLGLTDIAGIDQLEVNYNNALVPLSQVPNLVLDLSNNQLTALPDDICKLQLSWLILRNNKLATLLDSIDSLGRLELLALSHNNLTSLPSSLENMTELEHLYLGDNFLNQVVLPENLEVLVLSNNDLGGFVVPDTYFPAKLKRIYLNNNRINIDSFVAHYTLFNLASLWSLTLHDNLIKNLPIFKLMISLNKLTLNNNQLTALPDNFFENIKFLMSLDLSNNPFESLPSSLVQLKYLKSLRLVGCRNLPFAALTEINGKKDDSSEDVTFISFSGLSKKLVNSFLFSLVKLGYLRTLGLIGRQSSSLAPLVDPKSKKIERIAYLERFDDDTLHEKRKVISKFLTDLHQKNHLIFFDLWKALQTSGNEYHSLKAKVPQDIGDMINQYL